jgi:GxxExxY protein
MISSDRLAYLNSVSEKIIGAAIEVHKELGPGLLESVYEACLYHELKKQGVSVDCQVDLPIIYKGEITNKTYRIDMLVENCVIVELKSVDTINPIHEAQLLTYMKLLNINLGLLINFNVDILKKGIKRRILG